jgi:hypothetical protein
MKPKRQSRFIRELALIPDILLWFLAAVVPIMFLFSVIVGFDQVTQHRGLLADLDAHGRVISAEINQIDFESQRGRITLFYPVENGQRELAVIRILEFYPADWLSGLEKGQSLEILYVPPGPYHHAYEAVPLSYYLAIQRHPGITRDIWVLFLLFLLVAIYRPHFLFLGFVPVADMDVTLLTKNPA